MARRGFFAELHYQAKLAAQRDARVAREAERARKAAIREAQRAERARAARFAYSEREVRAAHVAEMEANAESQNADLSQVFLQIDSLLAATLDVDDYVDLDALRVVAQHPPFDRFDLDTPVPLPSPIPDPPEPSFVPPEPLTWFKGLFGKQKHAQAVAEATADYELAMEDWRSRKAQLESARQSAARRHAEMEAERISNLNTEVARYNAECAARAEDAARHNASIDKFIADLGYGAVSAVQEYVSIVLENSHYPEHFPVNHEFEFDAPSAELKLRVLVPSPDTLPTTKHYKYTRSTDTITATALSQKACKDRYAGAVHQVAIRSLHEIFEADRRGIIRTIALEVGTETLDPATGLGRYFPFVAVGAERDAFLEFDLANVVPAATLTRLGAAVSKNPFGLVPANSSGVRRS